MLLLIDKLRTVAKIYDTSQKTNLCCFVAERRRQATHKRAVSPSHNAAPMSAEFSPLQPWFSPLEFCDLRCRREQPAWPLSCDHCLCGESQQTSAAFGHLGRGSQRMAAIYVT